MRQQQKQTAAWAVVVALVLLSSSAAANGYGVRAAAAEPISSKPQQLTTTLLPDCAASGAAGGVGDDKCCVHNASPADCASTASKNKGCRSDSSCVPEGDPCSSASNEKGCLAAGSFCKFDINTFSCKLDAAQHPCAAVADPGKCGVTQGCRVQHVCRDSCASCPSCLQAMRAFAAMSSVLSQLDKHSSSSSSRDSSQTAFLKGYCHAAAAGVLKASPEELLAGCNRVAEDVARSPALLSRPAALCKRLGLCHANCLVDGTTSSSSSSSGRNASLPVSSPVSAPAPASSDAIDLCSPTGLASGASAGRNIDRSAAREGSVCLSSADCPTGMDCDTFSHSQCWSKCDQDSGMDTCLSAGQCVDVCQRPDIKLVVEDSQRRYKPCTSASTCAKGEECIEPKFPCTLVQCNPYAISKGLNPVEFVECNKICLPEAPKMLKAAFSDSGDRIEVTLNQEAAPMNILCAFVFDAATSELLGSASVCTTQGNKLTIWLAGDVKVRPGSSISLSDLNPMLTSGFGLGVPGGPQAFSGGVLRVEGCGNCSASAVEMRLTGPSEIALGCDGDAASAETNDKDDDAAATATDSPLDGLFGFFGRLLNPFTQPLNPNTALSSTGFEFVAIPPSSSLWMIQDLKWSVASPANATVDALRTIVADLNNQTNNWDRQVLTIPYETLSQMPEGPLTLTVDVFNVFGVRSSSALVVRKKNATQAPLFDLDRSVTGFYPSAGFRVDSNPLPSACPNTKVTFKWSSTIPNVDVSDATGGSVAFTPQDLLGNVEIGKAYTVTLTAAYEGSSGSHSESVTLLATGSPLSVNLSGPSGTIPWSNTSSQDLVYDAQGSVDPDDPYNTASPLSFQWSCVNTLDLTPCFGRQLNGKYVINATQLKEDVRYLVSVTLAKGDRSATASRSITPTSGNRQGLSAQVRRSCGVDVATGQHLPCPSLHNPTDPLTLVAVPDAPFDMEDMLLSWWYDPLTVPTELELSDNNTASGVTLPSLTVLPDGLPAGGAITINVNFSINPDSPKFKDNAASSPENASNTSGAAATPAAPLPAPPAANFSGTTSLTVPLNGPPYCSSPAGECISLDRSVATFPEAHFKVCAVAWADPEASPLSYEFGTVVSTASNTNGLTREQRALATNAGSCYTFASLPTGPSTLYACAVDSLGARACQEVDVAVLAPSKPVSSADVDEKLQQLNAELDAEQNKTATASPGTLVDKAMEVTSLLSSTTKQAANSIVDIVDTTVNGFKNVFTDLKKAFSGPWTLTASVGDDVATERISLASLNERGTRSSSKMSPKLLVSSSPSATAESSSKNKTDAAAVVLPASTEVAVANATTKLLRLMADASSQKDADQTFSLLTAGEQLAQRAPLTPQGGVALLEIVGTAMSASSQSSRSLSPQMSNTMANALTRGLDAATTASPASKPRQQQQQQQHRRLQAADAGQAPRDAKGSIVLLSPDQAFEIIRDGAYKLAAAQKVTLGVVEPPVGNAGVCIGPALLSRKDVDSFTTQFDCQGIEAPAEAILPSNFSAACTDSTDCLMVDGIMVLGGYFSPGSRSVPIIMAVVNNPNRLLPESADVETEVVSGVMNITLSYSGPVGAFCAGQTFADVLAQGPGCKAELELPLSKAFDASKSTACVQLLPDPATPGRLKPGAVEPVVSVRSMELSAPAPSSASSGSSGRKYSSTKPRIVKRSVATCSVAQQGMWVVAQFEASAVAAGAGGAKAAVGGAAKDNGAASSDSSSSSKSGGDVAESAGSGLGATLGSYELIPGEYSDSEAQVNKKAAMTFTYAFDLDGDAITRSPVESMRFRSELQRAFLAGTVEAWSDGPDLADNLGALRLAHVTVSNIRTLPASSTSSGKDDNVVAADVTLLPPVGTTPVQLAQLAVLPPAELLLSSSKLRKELVSSERASLSGVAGEAAPRNKGLGGDVLIGVVIGCVGVFAAILAAAVVIVRRRATIKTHAISYSDDSEAQARQPFSTAGGAPGPSCGLDLSAVPEEQQQQQHYIQSPKDAARAAQLNQAASFAEAAAAALRMGRDDYAEEGGRDAASLAEAAAAALKQ